MHSFTMNGGSYVTWWFSLAARWHPGNSQTPITFDSLEALPPEELSLEGKVKRSVDDLIQFRDHFRVRDLPAIPPHEKPKISDLQIIQTPMRFERHQPVEEFTASRVPAAIRHNHGAQRHDRPCLDSRHAQ